MGGSWFRVTSAQLVAQMWIEMWSDSRELGFFFFFFSLVCYSVWMDERWIVSPACTLGTFSDVFLLQLRSIGSIV